MQLKLTDAEQTQALGAALAEHCTGPMCIYLQGNLGVGKTTLVRGFLRALGHTGAVKSPTYTLIEPYELTPDPVFHLDLYRLADPEELEYLGIRDLIGENAILLIEWPEQGAGGLPPPDLTVAIEYEPDARLVEITAQTARGKAVLGTLTAAQLPRAAPEP